MFLVDGDLTALVLLCLRDDDRENAVLHGGFDVVLVDTDREGERPGELAYASFRDPVLGFGLLKLLRLLGLFFGDFGRCLTSVLILYGSCLAFVLVTASSLVFDEVNWLGDRGVRALDMALDSQGVVVSEFEGHILLLNAREFALQLVEVTDLLDVELRAESLDLVAMMLASWVSLTRVLIKVIQQTEQGMEGGIVVGAVAGEVVERHLV